MIHHRPNCHHKDELSSGSHPRQTKCRCICTCPEDYSGAIDLKKERLKTEAAIFYDEFRKLLPGILIKPARLAFKTFVDGQMKDIPAEDQHVVAEQEIFGAFREIYLKISDHFEKSHD